MIFLFNYLKLGIWSTLYYFKPNDITFNIIVNNIKNCGPIVIKLTQWILPKIESMYDIDKYDQKNEWFNKLEEVYENCEFHSLDYTKQKYKYNNKAYFNKEHLIASKNDLEKIVLNKYPKVKSLKYFLSTLPGLIFVRMTGSGSTIVAYFKSKKVLDIAARIFRKKYSSYWSIKSKTI